ncbi:MAG: hypothetical protein OEZ43_05720 [Gammaproteobacteria bacterium]|nr:hypothetical protein [Gammaproteobacteria bacterium]
MNTRKRFTALAVLCGALLSSEFVSAANWERRPVELPREAITSVAYDATLGVFVAGGAAGHIVYSSDGSTWNDASLRNISPLTLPQFASDGSKFVMAGYSAVYTSTDGASWSSTYLMPNKPTDLYYDGTQFIATLQDSSNILLSTDAVTWTASNTGVTWLMSIAFDGTTYVAVGSAGQILTSTDLTTWTSRTSGVTTSLNKVIYDATNSLFVIVGNGGKILTAAPTQLALWATKTSGVTANLVDVVEDGSRLVVTGDGTTGPLILTSTDATTWTSQTSSSSILNNRGYVASSGTTIVVGSDMGVMESSTDGVTWTVRANSNSPLYDHEYNAGLYVAVGKAGRIATSPDLTTWTNRTSGVSSDLKRVEFLNGLWIAVGSSGVITTSSDGVTWTSQSSGVAQALRGVTHDGTKYIAVGDLGVVITSSDAVTWASQTSGTTQTLHAIASNGTDIVASGNTGTIITSSDSGVTWTTQTAYSSRNLYALRWDGTNFNIVTRDDWRTSSDGVTWTAVSSNTYTGDVYDVHSYNGTAFFTQGDDIYTSTDGGVNVSISDGSLTADQIWSIVAGPMASTAFSNNGTLYALTGFELAQTGTTDVTEGGATDTYTLVLKAPPAADVTITPSFDSEVSVAPASLTFTAANWYTPQTITVTAVDDSIAESVYVSTISHSAASTDAAYNTAAVGSLDVNVTDNDVASVSRTESGGSTLVVEGGATDTLSIVLGSQPTANVSVSMSVGSQISLSPSTLTFTSANWSTAQTVTVSAVDDNIDEAPNMDTVTYAISSIDSSYNGYVLGATAVNVTDNDTASITVSQSGGSTTVSEGGATDTYTLVLATEPTADVSITLAGGTELGVSPASVTFTSANWSTPQTITVSANDDARVEATAVATITHTVVSTDSFYNGFALADVSATVNDNDSAGITVTETAASTSVAEGGATDSYSVVLTSEPSANVVVTPSSGGEVTLSPTSLTFTAANWNVAQGLTVTAVDDGVAEGAHTDTITHVASSTDTNYSGLGVASVTANIGDNDTVGVSVVVSGSNTVATEGASGDNYTVVLTSQPSADVVINITSTGQVTVSPASLTFTSTNWNTAQTVTVDAVDDSAIEMVHSDTISHAISSADTAYAAASAASVAVIVNDNDTPAVLLNIPAGFATDEGGASLSYTIELATQPTADVIVTLSPSSRVSVATSTLTFTTANWSTPQSVVVTPLENSVVDVTNNATIGHTVSSTDGDYNAIAVDAVSVGLVDNDILGIGLTESDDATFVDEGGVGDTYTLVLMSEPLADVTVTLTPSSRLNVSSSTVTFTPANWNTAQTVTITVTDNTVVDTVLTGTIGHSVSSTDSAYAGFMLRAVNVEMTDDDLPVASEDPATTDDTGSGDTTTDSGTETTTATKEKSSFFGAFNWLALLLFAPVLFRRKEQYSQEM